ncbi:AraC family transcriptional regulator [Elizabethkingia anophelis]|uniref:AraC family transcriptional regulator n=1 Tax=Elizabethkingia anophelis TaxID=1117645 RepID=UPI0021A2AAE4|nr:AraC family transcriptional regulator [Elizabethkingia anophelis]MCT3648401.1 helix-turn-helix transcriptional regulator [Elizabethkingia anophelis]MCT3695427.1 helix-turn-helix transcriptional regulator [Elizabethkingia anophelis]MCT3859391.1 helix-turn-helix transcriptional regulator [Elizabethkingia anophelis]MCT3912696.1 helix-turn-helix transcriptional regulator [Elizabethkingia anophelis]MCT4311722.1 helix-turn-helix transcriptional regulator [Elizabethkingia anophelis]
MNIQNLYSPYDLELLEIHNYEAKPHKNTFFEMVFVLDGSGFQIINDHQLPYAPDKLFLIFPQDKHSFQIDSFSRFFFIRFNNDYLKTQNSQNIRELEYIFNSHNHLPGCILKTVNDKPLIRAAVEALIREKENNSPHRDQIIQQLINTIISYAARNLTLQEKEVFKGQISGVMPVINYLHQHIFEPEKLKVSNIARTFNLSPKYVGEYFKKHTGESLQQYIMLYKLKLIESRLTYTDMRISEIAFEFGFTDQSHLNRIFKKYKGTVPSAYRK